MTTKHDPRVESSVAVAFAELHQLERDRATFAAAKRVASEHLGRQAREISTLRSRLETERPRAWARVRRAADRRRRMREREEAALLARTQADHRERLARHEAELEAKRRRLAAIEATPTVERPSRRVLEWSVPAAAIALVAALGFLTLGEEQAVAHDADPRDTFELLNAEEPEFQAPFAATVPYAAPVPVPELEAEPEPKPEPKATKRSSGRKKSATKPKPNKPAPKKKPVEKKHSNPLKIGDFNGNPLG